mmetsp:Transcript_12659/g.53077  ORF Transcript_12659/g.53077 Transcript_12659/m.53077 type:complete len:287 (+) Transcript_12659:1023-1883(+)
MSTALTRSSNESTWSADRVTAMRSRRCSRSAPSSGLNVAMRSGLHGCLNVMPSRSTTFSPSASTVSSRLDTDSSSRLISSTYKMPRCASASKPGWNTVLPSFMDASMSTVPTRRSSVTPKGTCTKGASRMRVITSPLASRVSFSSKPSSQVPGSSGSELQMEPSTTSMGGSSACSPRAMMDFAVPRRPEMAMPPSAGSMAPSSSADLIFSWPTTAARGNVWRMPELSTSRALSRSIAAASAARAAMTSGSATDARATKRRARGVCLERDANAFVAPRPETGERRAA